MQPLGEALRGFLKTMSMGHMRDIVEVFHSESSPLAGQLAGRLLLKRSIDGEVGYQYLKAPMARPELAMAELEIHHRFGDLDDLRAYLERSSSGTRAAFIQTERSSHAMVRVVDLEHPEGGDIHMDIERHPSMVRWSREVPMYGRVDLDAARLAELILDRREDLADPSLVDRLVALGDDGEPPPRDIEVAFPVYAGAWPPGDEPVLRATIRMMEVASRGTGSGPVLRLRWADAFGLELNAGRVLAARVRQVLGDVVPVYWGSPRVTRYVMPRRES